jgi:hypothetical protein
MWLTNPGVGTDLVITDLDAAGGSLPSWTASGMDIVELLLINDGSAITVELNNIVQAVATAS